MPKIKISIPNDFVCSITYELMIDPVITCDGQAYEREAIEKWLKDHDTSPNTNLKLKDKTLTVIPFIKNQIMSFIEKNELCTQDKFFKAIEEIIEKQRPLFTIQKLNYLESYLAAKSKEVGNAGNTLLHIAVIANHTEMVAWLLAEGANPKLKGKYGQTPLHLAKTKAVAKLLLAEGALLEATNDYGETALHTTAIHGYGEVVEFLLDEGANSQARNNHGDTPEIIHEMNASMSDRVPHDYKKIKYLLLVKKPNFEDKYGSELHVAVQYEQVEKVKYLLWLMREHGESIGLERKDKEGLTPFYLAVIGGNVEIVKLLLTVRVNLNSKITHLWKTETPLHAAVNRNHKEIVKLLLEHGADINVKNHDNLTPVNLKEAQEDAEIIKLFRMHEAPEKIAELEKITQQQSQLIQLMQTQIQDLTRQLQQLTTQQNQNRNNTNSNKNYSPSFSYTKKS